MIKKTLSFLFTNKTDGQTITKNALWLVCGKLGGRLLRAAVVIYAIRILGAADWGVFSYAMSVISLFAILTDFGISPLLIRETAKENPAAKKERLLSTAFSLKIMLLVPATFFILYGAHYLPILTHTTHLLGLFSLILICDSFRQLGFSLIKAQEKMEIQAGLYLLMNSVIAIAVLVLLAASPSITSLTYAYALGAGVALCGTVFVLRSHLRAFKPHFHLETAREIMSSGWPLAISGLIGSIMISTDIFLIGFFQSAQEVGFYSIADRVIQLLYAPALIIATSTFPVFSRLSEKSGEQTRLIFRKLTTIICFCIIPLIVVGIATAPFLIKIIFGSEYLPATLTLQILFPTLLLRYVSVLLSNVVFAHNKHKVLAHYAGIGLVLNIVLDLALIPLFGIAGSAAATLIAHTVSGLYLWKKALRIINT